MTLTELIRQKNIAFGDLCRLERECYRVQRRRRPMPHDLAQRRAAAESKYCQLLADVRRMLAQAAEDNAAWWQDAIAWATTPWPDTRQRQAGLDQLVQQVTAIHAPALEAADRLRQVASRKFDALWREAGGARLSTTFNGSEMLYAGRRDLERALRDVHLCNL